MFIAYGLLFGVIVGVLTGHLAICIALGTSFAVLAAAMRGARNINKPDA